MFSSLAASKTQRAIVLWSCAALALAASSGCAAGVVSRRITTEPDCAADVNDDLAPFRPGIPVAIIPSFSLPRCFRRAGRQELNEDFREMLQPAPAAPLKPPHSRFHPLPTQPVFATRADYSAPQPLDSPTLPVAEPALYPLTTEEIPVPVPETLPGDPPASELVVPQPSEEKPSAQPLPLPLQQPGDASRGNVAPASFLRVVEPNPLRDGASTTSRQLRR